MLRICALSLLKYSYNRPRKSDDPKNSLKHHSLWTAPPKTPPPSYLLVSKGARPYSITKDDRPLRRYPIGKSDYKKIKEEKFFAFDKTLFLKHFFDDGAEVTLLLRPRRFAKTTTMSMLKYFSDMNEPQASREMMFKDTKIWSEQGGQYVRDHCGQYPVIFITFNEISNNNWSDMKANLTTLISDVYKQHRYLMEKDFLMEDEKIEFKRVLQRSSDANYQMALRKLSEYLYRYHNKKVIILIDEYDKPVNHAYIHKFSTEAIGFMSVAFAGALKDNPHLYKGLMTGVLRIAKAGYLSGLNNLKVHSLLEPASPYSTDIGVVHNEAIEALSYEGLEDKIDAVEKYYNGYTVGTDPKQRLFNSWSVINYLNDKVLKPYWVETGSTNLLEEQLMRANKEVHVQMEELLVNGKEIRVPVLEDVNFSSLKDGYDQIWSLLFFSGYITGRKVDVNEDEAMVRVPNEEILHELKKMYKRILQRLMAMRPESCIASLIRGDVTDFEKGLKEAAINTFSFYDVNTKKSNQEVAYHVWVLGFVEPLRSVGYTIKSNREAGVGRYDILLTPNVPNDQQYSVILEFKAPDINTKVEKEIMSILDQSANEALQQIKVNKYHVEARSKKILSLGIALHKKYLSIKYEKES